MVTAVVLRGDAAHLPLPDASVDLIVTSPPYWGLRSYTDNVKCLKCIDMERDGRDPRQAWPDYDAHVRRDHVQHYDGQIGSEATPAEYIDALVACTREWVRVLKPQGSLFVNLGDKYAQDEERSRNGLGARNTGLASGAVIAAQTIRLGRKDNGVQRKSLLGLPWRYALACMDDLGLILRAEIIWDKPNGLPESVADRVRRSHEQVFHFTVRPRYYAAVDEIREPHSDTSLHARTRRDRTDKRLVAANGGQTSAANPLGKLPGSVWPIPSAPLTVPAHLGVDHFAAYPPELCRRIIAGWSPPGICTECGEGRRPVSDAVKHLTRPIGAQQVGTRMVARGPGDETRSNVGNVETLRTITGYACACPQPDAPTRPAVVLDPFGGTGTTALVAASLGRAGITVDRSGDYCRLARWRTADPGERARVLGVPRPPPVPDGQASLFDLDAS